MRLSALLLVALPMSLAAQVSRDSTISVSATRTTRVPPDRASFYLIVEGTAETPADAITRVDAKLKTVSEALNRFGSRIRLDPAIAYGVGPNQSMNPYPGMAAPSTNVARSVIRVQLDRPEQTAQVVAAAIGAGASSSSSLTFESSAADSVRRARMGEALKVAHADAEAIAGSLGARLGALVSVTTTGAPFGFQSTNTLNFDSRFGQQAQTPDVTVATTVTVLYRIVR